MINAPLPPLAIIVTTDMHGRCYNIVNNDQQHQNWFKKLTHQQACVMDDQAYNQIINWNHEKTTNPATINNKETKEDTNKQTQILTGCDSFVVTNHEVGGAIGIRGINEALMSYHITQSRSMFVIGGITLFTEAFAFNPIVHMAVAKHCSSSSSQFPIEILNNRYRISSGSQTENYDFITYTPKYNV